MTRKSKREIEHALDELGAPVGDYPTPTLAHILRHDWELVDESRNLKRNVDTGEIFHFPEEHLSELWRDDFAGADG